MLTERRLLVLVIGIGAWLAWYCWPTLGQILSHRASDLELPTGYVVTGLAAFGLWRRRSRLSDGPLHGSWWGVVVIGVACVPWFWGAGWLIPLKPASVIPFLTGCCLIVGGWALCRWIWPVLTLLVLLLSLPPQAEEAVGNHLSPMAASAAAYLLQTVGRPAVAESSGVVLVDETGTQTIQTAGGLDAVIFLAALAGALAMVGRKEHWQNVLLVLSALPLALGINILRTVCICLLSHSIGGGAESVVRGLAGWAMLPAGLAALCFVGWVLDNIVIQVDPGVDPLWSFGLAKSLKSNS